MFSKWAQYWKDRYHCPFREKETDVQSDPVTWSRPHHLGNSESQVRHLCGDLFTGPLHRCLGQTSPGSSFQTWCFFLDDEAFCLQVCICGREKGDFFFLKSFSGRLSLYQFLTFTSLLLTHFPFFSHISSNVFSFYHNTFCRCL